MNIIFEIDVKYTIIIHSRVYFQCRQWLLAVLRGRIRKSAHENKCSWVGMLVVSVVGLKSSSLLVGTAVHYSSFYGLTDRKS